MKKKNGFTLIELLAVIIILGILMIIAIPSVTKYISDSRKNSYVDSAKEIVGSARNLVNSGELEMYDTDATYYIDVNCIKTENAMKSPYGDFVKEGAYVVVTYDGKGYDYFWTSVDDAGQGVKNIVKYDKLDTDDISSDLTIDDISTLRTLDGRGKVILITERNSCKKEGAITENLIPVNSETGEEGGSSGGGTTTPTDVAVYPDGKTKATVTIGDIVTIGTEEFYVIKPLTDGKLTLLSHYNLNVGSNKKAGATEGLQDSDVKGWLSSGTPYGTIAFSSTNYWNGKVGEGLDYPKNYCTSSSGTNCAYVYYDKNKNIDSANTISTYVEAYKTKLIQMGQPVEEARLLRVEEAFELGCETNSGTCNSAPTFVKETSYWLGSAYSTNFVWDVYSNGRFSLVNYYYHDNSFGVRPVIVI